MSMNVGLGIGAIIWHKAVMEVTKLRKGTESSKAWALALRQLRARVELVGFEAAKRPAFCPPDPAPLVNR